MRPLVILSGTPALCCCRNHNEISLHSARGHIIYFAEPGGLVGNSELGSLFVGFETLRANCMNAEYIAELALLHSYRLAGYALPNWSDDAAILAFMFC
jgi:hypothetical protein